MAIEIINVGGQDYDIRDQISKAYCDDLYNKMDTKPHLHAIQGNEETTDYYSIARGVNSFFIWRADRDIYPKNGCLMKTTRAVVRGETILNGYNCTQMPVMHAVQAMDVTRNGNDVSFQAADGTVRDLGDFSTLNTPNMYKQPNKFLSYHQIYQTNFDEAPLILAQTADDAQNRGGRASLAFHNGGVNACQIYYDHDGQLHFLSDDGRARKIVMEQA